MATSLSFISLLTKWLPTTEATSDDQTLYFHFESRSSRLKGIAGQMCVGRLIPVVTKPLLTFNFGSAQFIRLLNL